jgi:hypothetical protein
VCEFHSTEQAVVRRNVESCQRFCQLVSDIGGRGVKVRPNDLPQGVPTERTLEQIGRALAECGRTANDTNTEIWVEVHGRPAFTSCTEIGEPVDLALMLVGANRLPDALADAASAGISSVVVLASGFGEAGGHGASVQSELVELCRELDVVCLGPNCLGFVNVVDRAPAWSGMMPVPLVEGQVVVDGLERDELDAVPVVAIDGVQAGGAAGVVVWLRDNVELDPGLHAARIITRGLEPYQACKQVLRKTGQAIGDLLVPGLPDAVRSEAVRSTRGRHGQSNSSTAGRG